MITDFKSFSPEHISALIIPIIIFLMCLQMRKKTINAGLIFAILLILIRSVRYIFDLILGEFMLIDLFSLHICHIVLLMLIVNLIKPNKKLLTFMYLIGVPTALAVALFPGPNHTYPGMIRAVFFVMSHMMIVMGILYLMITEKHEIKTREIFIYYILPLIVIVLMYFLNNFLNTNYMYLIDSPSNTILSLMQDKFGNFYQLSIYILLAILLTILYLLNKIVIIFLVNNKK